MDLKKIEKLLDKFSEKLTAELDSSQFGKILDEMHYNFHHEMVDAIHTAKRIATAYEAYKNPKPRKRKAKLEQGVF